MKKILLTVSLMSVVGLSARYATIESEAEFDRRLNDSNFSVVCFADSTSEQGKEIAHNLRRASSREEFGTSLHDKVGFFLVRAERDKNQDLIKKHGYSGSPFCATFKRDYKTRSSNMSGSFSGADFSDLSIRKFLRGEFDSELNDLVEDIREERERKESHYNTLSPRVHIGYGVGYRPWWNRWWYGPRYRYYGYGRRYGHPYRHYRHHGHHKRHAHRRRR